MHTYKADSDAAIGCQAFEVWWNFLWYVCLWWKINYEKLSCSCCRVLGLRKSRNKRFRPIYYKPHPSLIIITLASHHLFACSLYVPIVSLCPILWRSDTAAWGFCGTRVLRHGFCGSTGQPGVPQNPHAAVSPRRSIGHKLTTRAKNFIDPLNFNTWLLSPLCRVTLVYAEKIMPMFL